MIQLPVIVERISIVSNFIKGIQTSKYSLTFSLNASTDISFIILLKESLNIFHIYIFIYNNEEKKKKKKKKKKRFKY